MLTEYDAELKSRELVIAELREALGETKRNANSDDREEADEKRFVFDETYAELQHER